MMLLVFPDLDALFLKLQPFVQTIVPAGTPVLRGPLNRTAQPAVDHAVMTPLFFKRLRTNVDSYDDPAPESDPGTALFEEGIEQHIQLDFYGAQSANWATAASNVFRSAYAVDALAPTCAPLYADEARMIPLVTGEEQYLERWSLTAVLQYNPVTVVPQQFADAAEVVLVEVDTRFPPP